MKIGVFGNYGHSNIGDEAILRGLFSLLKDNNVNVYSDSLMFSKCIHPEHNKFWLLKPVLRGRLYMLPLILICMIKNILRNDIVIIGGGGLFNDINKTAFFQYLFILLVSRILLKKVYVVGISVGPLNSRMMKSILKFVSLCANKVYVRDNNSLGYFWEFNTKLMPDLSLGAILPCDLTGQNPINTKLYIVSISLMDITKTYSKATQAYYLKKIKDFIVQLKIEQNNLKIEFLAMDFDKDIAIISPLLKACTDLGVESELIKLDCFSKLDSAFLRSNFIVATRLHSAILAILFKKPFLAISYQPKVKNYFDSHNLGKVVIEIDDLQNSNLFVRYKKMLNKVDYISASNRNAKLELIQVIKELI